MNREEALSELKYLKEKLHGHETRTALAMAITAMEQPEQKKGHWIDNGDPQMWVCDKCGYRVNRWNNTEYCPKCGAYMLE